MSSPPVIAEPQERLIRIAGLPAVSALFSRDPDRIERLFFDTRTAAAALELCRVLARARKPFRQVDGDELARVAGTMLHGGIVAVARPRPVLAFDPAVARRWSGPILMLDGVGNPHNLGAIVRTAAFFGLDRLVISGHPGQAGPSEAAHRVAEGGLEHVTLYRADPIAAVLRTLQASHLVVGTALERGRPLDVADLQRSTRPVVLVLGNEEIGLPPPTLEACEAVVTITGSGRVQSLNVAATAAILIHALTRG
ncbi:MAG: RNA methyltransferase [Azospirillaceae bacterium]|nr:RNA methyltransferase [Azospirillaceae bacterium]